LLLLENQVVDLKINSREDRAGCFSFRFVSFRFFSFPYGQNSDKTGSRSWPEGSTFEHTDTRTHTRALLMTS